jgi:hypothetical protein
MKLLPLKLRIYENLYHLNRAFELVRLTLERLERFGFDSRSMRESRFRSEELRAETNHRLTELLHEREEKDWARFGRVVHQQEKRLRDPNDILREAERIRQKQRQQSPQPKQKPTTARKPRRAH